MRKRLLKDEYRETINNVEVVFSTDEFEEGNTPKRVDANFQTEDGGFYAGSYQIDNKRVNHNANNLSIEHTGSNMIDSIVAKLQEIAVSYSIQEGGVE